MAARDGLPTIRDVAREAGVSHMTVSRAFDGKSPIAEETRARILGAARRLGYRPNSLARGLASTRSETLGLLIPTLANPFFAEVTETLFAAAGRRGYDLIPALHLRDPELKTRQIERLLNRRVDGLLVWGGHPRRGLPQVVRAGRGEPPCVVLHTPARDESASYVAIDLPAGIRQAVEHLLRLGHTRIGYAGSDAGVTTVEESGHREVFFEAGSADRAGGAAMPAWVTRYGGFLAALRAADREPAACIRYPIPGLSPEDGRRVGYDTGRALACAPERPTALICAGDQTALGLIAGLRDAGLRVPEDLAVVGTDGIVDGAYSNPRLTSLSQPIETMVERALDILLQRIVDPNAPPARILLQPSLVVRESCGAPAAA